MKRQWRYRSENSAQDLAPLRPSVTNADGQVPQNAAQKKEIDRQNSAFMENIRVTLNGQELKAQHDQADQPWPMLDIPRVLKKFQRQDRNGYDAIIKDCNACNHKLNIDIIDRRPSSRHTSFLPISAQEKSIIMNTSDFPESSLNSTGKSTSYMKNHFMLCPTVESKTSLGGKEYYKVANNKTDMEIALSHELAHYSHFVSKGQDYKELMISGEYQEKFHKTTDQHPANFLQNDNTEEYDTITGSENAARRSQKMPLRYGHSGAMKDKPTAFFYESKERVESYVGKEFSRYTNDLPRKNMRFPRGDNQASDIFYKYSPLSLLVINPTKLSADNLFDRIKEQSGDPNEIENFIIASMEKQYPVRFGESIKKNMSSLTIPPPPPPAALPPPPAAPFPILPPPPPAALLPHPPPQAAVFDALPHKNQKPAPKKVIKTFLEPKWKDGKYYKQPHPHKK